MEATAAPPGAATARPGRPFQGFTMSPEGPLRRPLASAAPPAASATHASARSLAQESSTGIWQNLLHTLKKHPRVKPGDPGDMWITELLLVAGDARSSGRDSQKDRLASEPV